MRVTQYKYLIFRAAIACFALAMLASFNAGCSEEAIPEKQIVRPVKAIQVADPVDFREQWFPGQAKATQEVDLSFRVSGPLVALPVKVGDAVSAGDILAQIDPRDFEVEVRSARARLDRAKAAIRRAQSDYQRVVRIMREDPGAISQALLDQAREAYEAAKAEVQALEASLDTARDQLSYTHLKAPFDGRIVSTSVENFEDVRAKERIVRLLDSSSIEMIVGIPENMISLAPYVHDIVVVFDPFPDHQIAAKIKEIGTEASPTTRTYPVTLIMDQPKNVEILPGMAGKATGEPRVPEGVETASGITPSGLEIPVSAVFSADDPEKTYVWVVDEPTMTVRRREVNTGELLDRGIRLLSGVDPGEWVVTAGVNSLQEGQQVTILKESSA